MQMDIWTLNGVEYITVQDFAKVCQVQRQTIYRWIYLGMPAARSQAGSFLVPYKEALEWVVDYRR